PPDDPYPRPGRRLRRRCSVEKTAMILGAALALVSASCGRGGKEEAPAPSERPAIRSVRITMAALHQAGGVPPGWRFTVPPGDVAAGRRTFADAGCPSCHRVAREAFPPPTGPGPELTGMGSHHPAEYFVESILTPDAVLVDGPGYIGPDGRSVMPSYPDLTLRQLTDLVAYLKSLTAGGAAEMLTAAPPAPVKDLPAPPAEPTTYYYVQAYDVLPGRLDEFEAWFRDEGARAFLAHDGLVRVDRRRHALERHRAARAEDQAVRLPERRARRLGQQDRGAQVPRLHLQACRLVHGVADDGVGDAAARAHVAGDHVAGADADAGQQALAARGVALGERALEGDGRPHRGAGVVGERAERRAEDCHHAVAEELRDEAAFALDHPRDDGVVLVQQLDHARRRRALRERGEAAQVDEHRRRLGRLAAER